MHEIIELNKFSTLHDGKKIIFCKTDYILSELESIKKLPNQVVLITGNSDYPITDDIVKNLPKNIIKWYAQNALTFHEKIEPIPMGIENELESSRDGHGIGYYDRVKTKKSLLYRDILITPTKNIYSNFQINTNFFHRQQVKNICLLSGHIDWEEPNLPLENFFNKILDYKMVICPAGNGVDTHRIWEILYSHRVPITIKTGNYKIYDLYEKLPIIILDTISDLMNLDLINEKYEKSINNFKNIDMIDFNFWKNKILI
jgi:hypothetical protein